MHKCLLKLLSTNKHHISYQCILMHHPVTNSTPPNLEIRSRIPYPLMGSVQYAKCDAHVVQLMSAKMQFEANKSNSFEGRKMCTGLTFFGQSAENNGELLG